MDFNKFENISNGVIIKNVKNFELDDTFECGQCFRWYKEKLGSYIGVAKGRVIEVRKKDNDVIIYNTTEEDFNCIWAEYFDLYTDYNQIKDSLKEDSILKKAVQYGTGIRLLKQDPFEIILSFIISANNRIPMIKRAIKNISEKWGDEVKYKGKIYYTFPTLEQLSKATKEELEKCGIGFRAKYINDTVLKLYDNTIKDKNSFNKEYDIDWISSQEDNLCYKSLQIFSGVGPKVADCIMLFSMGKYSAFPVDVWVKRGMQYFYLAPDVSLKKIREFGRKKFGNLAGFAQQYLFYYARENKIDIKKNK